MHSRNVNHEEHLADNISNSKDKCATNVSHSNESTLDTAVCAASPRAEAGKPSISFLSVINFSNFFVESKTFSSNFRDNFDSSYTKLIAEK